MTAPAADLRFSFEWERGDGVAAAELAATWARLEVWVGEHCVTRVEDLETGSARRSIYAPLYPVAEWIAYNWWPLKANVRPTTLVTVSSTGRSHRSAVWMRSHNLRAAGDGFLWPNLYILPQGGSTRLVWRPDGRGDAAATVRYIVGGEATVDSAKTERVLADVVDAVLARLDERGIASALGTEWQAIQAADADEREFCLAAARLGFDPYGLDTNARDLIVDAASQLADPLLPDFLDSVTPSMIGDGLRWVARGSDLIAASPGEPDAQLSTLRAEVGKLGADALDMPWKTGWAAAQVVRNFTGIAPVNEFDFGDMIRLKRRPHGDRALEGLGGLTAGGSAALVLGRGSLKKPQSRFMTARALWHLTHDASPQRFLLTTSHADRQRSERAFAAELLAPGDGVRQLLPDDDGVLTSADIEDVAGHYAVSPLVVRHQVENQLGLQVA
jgi:hypothetical protein